MHGSECPSCGLPIHDHAGRAFATAQPVRELHAPTRGVVRQREIQHRARQHRRHELQPVDRRQRRARPAHARRRDESPSRPEPRPAESADRENGRRNARVSAARAVRNATCRRCAFRRALPCLRRAARKPRRPRQAGSLPRASNGNVEAKTPVTRQHHDIEIRPRDDGAAFARAHTRPSSRNASLPASVSATTAPTRSREAPSSGTSAACATYGCSARRASSSGSDTRLPSSLSTRSSRPCRRKRPVFVEGDVVVRAMPAGVIRDAASVR